MGEGRKAAGKALGRVGFGVGEKECERKEMDMGMPLDAMGIEGHYSYTKFINKAVKQSKQENLQREAQQAYMHMLRYWNTFGFYLRRSYGQNHFGISVSLTSCYLSTSKIFWALMYIV